MKLIKNIIKIIIIMIFFQIVFIPISNAFSFDDIFEQGDKFLDKGKFEQYVRDDAGYIKRKENGEFVTILDGDQMKDSINSVYNILLAIGVGLSVIIAAALGIKFMVGSIEEQAKIKEMLIPFALGCIVIFGAFGIWKFIMTLGGNIFN